MLTLFSKPPTFVTLFRDGGSAPQPVPSAPGGDEPDADYVSLSKQLDVNAIPLQFAELGCAIREVCIGIYAYEAVIRYLDRVVEEKRNHRWDSLDWYWRPVNAAAAGYRAHAPKHVSPDVYDKPIPLPVMLTIQRIKSRFPAAKFFVSDIREVSDPFLAVTVEGSDSFFVVERWDEPGFRSGSRSSRCY